MGAFGQPGLNAGYGSKRRQATLQSQGQMDLYGNRVRQAMQPNQGFAVYMQQAPQQQAAQPQGAGGGGFAAYAPQPAAQPAPQPAAMGSAQPVPPPSQGTPYRQPSQRTQPSDPEGYERLMRQYQDYWSPAAVAARQEVQRFAQQLAVRQQQEYGSPEAVAARDAAALAWRDAQHAKMQATIDRLLPPGEGAFNHGAGWQDAMWARSNAVKAQMAWEIPPNAWEPWRTVTHG